MKVKFLKKFRKRFSIKIASTEEQGKALRPALWAVTLIDHRSKRVDSYNDVSTAVAYAANTMGYYNLWDKRIQLLEERKERKHYFNAK